MMNRSRHRLLLSYADLFISQRMSFFVDAAPVPQADPGRVSAAFSERHPFTTPDEH